MNENQVRAVTKYREPTKRISAPFTEAELKRLDDWGFARRMRDRTVVIRELVMKGLEVSENEKAN